MLMNWIMLQEDKVLQYNYIQVSHQKVMTVQVCHPEGDG